MHWCRPTGAVEVLKDGDHVGDHRRATVDGWHCRTIKGTPLTSDRIAGNLWMVQRFEGGICRVKPLEYLLRKLNDEPPPELAAAAEAERALMDAIVRLMRLLNWQDFELLVDLAFSASGWRRIGVVGGVVRTADLELILPTTGERAFVQVKARASNADLQGVRR